jgi:hypothetical protein
MSILRVTAAEFSYSPVAASVLAISRKRSLRVGMRISPRGQSRDRRMGMLSRAFGFTLTVVNGPSNGSQAKNLI